MINHSREITYVDVTIWIIVGISCFVTTEGNQTDEEIIDHVRQIRNVDNVFRVAVNISGCANATLGSGQVRRAQSSVSLIGSV